jgi:uncharacterized protein (DUF433 family)
VKRCPRSRETGVRDGVKYADWKPFISADPEIMHGAVCFRGTRVPVSVVLDNLAAGETAATILGEYRSLRAEHIPAALGYAADLARERIVPVPA